MRFWDFFKKKELAEIERLRIHIENLKQYEQVLDAEEEAKRIIQQANNDSSVIIAHAKEDANSIVHDAEKRHQSLVTIINNLELQVSDLEQKYKNGLNTYKQLQKEIDVFKDTLEIAEYGLYQPHFNFDTSEQYKDEIIRVRERQKDLIKNNIAALGGSTISWNGSLAEGQRMVKQEKKIMLRAFNGECDSFIANVDWNNIARMEERIQKSYDAINKAHSMEGIYISSSYLELKKKELHLAFEYKDKKHEEKEEQRQIREQMREEKKPDGKLNLQ